MVGPLRSPDQWPSPWTLLGVALTTAPLAFRRIYPITAFCVIMVAIIATSGHTTSITFAAVIFAAYSAVAYSPFRRLALLGVLAAAIIVTAAYPNTSPPVPERFGALLVLLPDRGGRDRDTHLAPPGRRVRRTAAPWRRPSTRPRPAARSRWSGPGSPARCTTW